MQSERFPTFCGGFDVLTTEGSSNSEQTVSSERGYGVMRLILKWNECIISNVKFVLYVFSLPVEK